jgi:hypothetical protein
LVRKSQDIFPLLNRKMDRQLGTPGQPLDGTFNRWQKRRLIIEQAHIVLFPRRFRKQPDLLTPRIMHWRAERWEEALQLALEVAVEERELPEALVPVCEEISRAMASQTPMPIHLRFMFDLWQAYELQVWKQPGQTEVEQLARDLAGLKPCLSKDTFANLHLLLFNLMIRKQYFQPGAEVLSLLFDAFQESLDNGYWPITRQAYRTMANIMSYQILLAEEKTQKETLGKALEEFLFKYKAELPPAEREEAYQLNLASYHFATEQYDKVLLPPVTLQFSDPFYEVGYEMVCLQARYEVGEREELFDTIHRLKQRIRKVRAFSPSKKASHLNRLKFMGRLLKVTKKAEGQALLAQIRATQPVGGHLWFERVISRSWPREVQASEGRAEG